MAAAPPSAQFRKGDFPSDGLGSQDALDKLFLPLNAFTQAVQTAMRGGLTLSDNFNAELKTLAFSTPTTPWITPNATGAPVLSNGWTLFGTSALDIPSFMLDPSGTVFMRGRIASGTVGSAAFTLPAGHWPTVNMHFAIPCSTDIFGILTVDSSGQVIPSNPAGNAYIELACSFKAGPTPAPSVMTCFPQVFATKVAKPTGVQVIRVQDNSSDSSPPGTALGGVDWTILQNGQISVRNIPGLAFGRKYAVTLLVTG